MATGCNTFFKFIGALTLLRLYPCVPLEDSLGLGLTYGNSEFTVGVSKAGKSSACIVWIFIRPGYIYTTYCINISNFSVFTGIFGGAVV